MDTEEEHIIGINYEGGKIITHILQYSQCVAYANCQIAMDAPYHGRVAFESIRRECRSETQFSGYDEDFLINQLKLVFGYTITNYPDIKIVIQVSRGRSAYSMINEILLPILMNLKIVKYEFICGYRSDQYYIPNSEEKIIFINIGMFAVLSGIYKTTVGEILNPKLTLSITDISDDKMQTDMNIIKFNDELNILNKISIFSTFLLAGIKDSMPFITPDKYPKFLIDNLIKDVKEKIKDK
jgi:hypothetical protein